MMTGGDSATRARAASWCAGLLSVLAVVPVAAAQTISGTVVAVHDGDTISVRTSSATVRIRLAGIDCPEYRQPYSARAKQFTSTLVFGKAVIVRGNGTDQYERLLGRVFVDGVDVNETIVRAGLAWHYEIASADPRLADAEKTARAARAGLWAEASPVPPWRWRKGKSVGR